MSQTTKDTRVLQNNYLP